VGHRPPGAPWLAPDDWLAQAERHDGSWWPAMAQWLQEHSSGTVPAREILADKALGPAPGEHVKVRYAD